MTNIMGNELLNGRKGIRKLPELLEHLKSVAIDTNKEWAERLSIPQSTAVTCVKPEGTSTQLAGVDGFGISTAWSEYHIRRIRELADGPVAQMLIEAGFPYEVDAQNSKDLVFDFPKHASPKSIFRKDMTAIKQLEHWKLFQDHWCEHKPSVTVYARENEWPSVGGWVYDNFDQMSGVSFLPYTDHVYKQAPYEEITETKYEELVAEMPQNLDLAELLADVEKEDNTTGGRELACVAGHCEI